tara:strand:- start:1147 stop:1464 length:318 start_codon:yes stop_codon:yes gene_type:complete
MKEFIKNWAWQILAILFLLLFMGRGCTGKKVSKTNKLIEENHAQLTNTVDSLTNRLIILENNSVSSKEARDIMESVMLEYLIYEDDLDKGKISLSQIKNKIEQND